MWWWSYRVYSLPNPERGTFRPRGSFKVAENVARKYGVSKSDLLNPEADDLAVRMALGETHIIAETKKALSSEGVNIEILEDLASGKVEKMKRSNHVLLIKNLPFSTSEADLMQMFGRFGRLERVILPPTKTMALDSRAKQWRVQAVAVSPDKFESRKPLPESWRGLRDDELSRECGIPDCVFVHISGFIGGNKSFDGALAMAKAALKL